MFVEAKQRLLRETEDDPNVFVVPQIGEVAQFPGTGRDELASGSTVKVLRGIANRIS